MQNTHKRTTPQSSFIIITIIIVVVISVVDIVLSTPIYSPPRDRYGIADWPGYFWEDMGTCSHRWGSEAVDPRPAACGHLSPQLYIIMWVPILENGGQCLMLVNL
jgi:hypothetical protein